MAGNGYDVDPAVLTTQGGVFSRIGADFSQDAAALKSSLSESEEWGDDDFVGMFNNLYKPISQGIVGSMPHLGKELSGIGERLQSMGEQYRRSDDEQVDQIHLYAARRPDLSL